MKDVDTDLIIPAQFLTSISRDGYGQNLFRRLRDNDPNFPFNLPQYSDAQILVAQSNFGCGSSREHAVWALQGAGIKVVIASSFADIFFNNSAKNGLVLVQLTQSEVEAILSQAAAGECTLTVDLEKQTVTAKNGEYKFDFDSFRRHCILNGLDDIDYILSFQNEIAKFREAQPAARERRHPAGTLAKSEGP
jgi:3-isopropylmalate/(R)-2-methylmalate dehydratase small subunit